MSITKRSLFINARKCLSGSGSLVLALPSTRWFTERIAFGRSQADKDEMVDLKLLAVQTFITISGASWIYDFARIALAQRHYVVSWLASASETS
ncbi:MAG: hypothetical protein ING68_07535 [Rhodocyclaceae bacterium]|nr:hypothetical protein [Rhodocyclaceae bacterium]MCA3022008.1 hypothetical protein [Rhodocyclaceae bacterium]MCA3053671.1 hypothetical protein [Rhodocyclaceae bacterium]